MGFNVLRPESLLTFQANLQDCIIKTPRIARIKQVKIREIRGVNSLS